MNDKFYFGVWSKDQGGHFLYNEAGSVVYKQGTRMPEDFPCSPQPDTVFLPPKLPEEQGRASFFHLNGWTILSFWDRSGDSRGKCNSTFIFRGNYDFPAMLVAVEFHFPSIWARFDFKIVQK